MTWQQMAMYLPEAREGGGGKRKKFASMAEAQAFRDARKLARTMGG